VQAAHEGGRAAAFAFTLTPCLVVLHFGIAFIIYLFIFLQVFIVSASYILFMKFTIIHPSNRINAH